MDRQTLERLANNPHYKMSKKQLEEYNRLVKQPMVTIGQIKTHSNKIGKHNVVFTANDDTKDDE